jgi:hypothetical protein
MIMNILYFLAYVSVVTLIAIKIDNSEKRAEVLQLTKDHIFHMQKIMVLSGLANEFSLVNYTPTKTEKEKLKKMKRLTDILRIMEGIHNTKDYRELKAWNHTE